MRDTPALYLVTGAMLIGDAAGNFRMFIPLWMAATGGGVAAAMYLGSLRCAGLAFALLAISACASSAVRPLLQPPDGPASLLRFADDSRVTVEGYVARAPEKVAGEPYRLRFELEVERAGASGSPMMPITGRIRITVAGAPRLQIGDELRVTSRIRFPRDDGNPGEFNYRDWLLRDGITATMFVDSRRGEAVALSVTAHRRFLFASIIEAIRERIGAFIDANLGYPANAELRALLIGDRGAIDEPLRQRFALTGMAHLLVIGGLHLGFVAASGFALVWMLCEFFPIVIVRGYANKLGAAAAAIAACSYAAIAGHHVSTIRALIMLLCYGLAVMLDRSRELISSLALAALVICFLAPGSTADIGFQLSFASVLVILLGMRRFAAWWRWRYRNPLAPVSQPSRLHLAAELVVGYVAVSFWALLGTAPLTAFHFNQFSLVGLIANAVVVPIMGLGAVVCGLLAAAMSFGAIAPARYLLWIAGKLAAAGNLLAGWFLAWPFAWERVFTPTMLELFIIYGFILLWLTAPLKGAGLTIRQARFDKSDSDQESGRRLRMAAALALGFALILDTGWWLRERYFNPDLRVDFLAVGEGDAAVVRFPGSRVMLVDGGGGFRSSFDPGERIVAPMLWSRKIMHVDYVTLSHPDRDHFGGLIFIARNFSPAEFWTSGSGSSDESYGVLMEAMARAGALRRTCDSTSAPVTIGAVGLRCVGPLASAAELKQNNSSMVLRMNYGPTSILFSGDLEARGERELIAAAANLRATLLKVPHHGSRTSSTAAFIAAVRPAAAVVSVGYLNRFHFPASDVIDRYTAAGVTVLRTDLDGAISADADGTSLSLRSFRGGPMILDSHRR